MTAPNVIIVGAGPVGMFLAIRLAHSGIASHVLERRTQRDTHSRAIGIHPPILELFDTMNLSSLFIDAGVKVYRGIAHGPGEILGSLSFEDCPKPFNHILSIPQAATESILEAHLQSILPESLMLGYDVKEIIPAENTVILRGIDRNGSSFELQADYIVACDGKNSIVRNALAIPFTGARYPDTYVMADFNDSTLFGRDAHIFLHPDGLVESFPLPCSQRRWVIKTSRYIQHPQLEPFIQTVEDRTGERLAENEHRMISSFGIQKHISRKLVRGRVILAGDAAHIMSPIGGQGMNTGFLDADDIGRVFTLPEKDLPDGFRAYETRALKRARRAIRRAAFNTILGRKMPFWRTRNRLIKRLLHSSFQHRMAMIYSMRGI